MTNREKNTAHDQRQTIRPKNKDYDFTALNSVMRAFVLGQAGVAREEVYSPYLGAL
jgi:hypothetical protein